MSIIDRYTNEDIAEGYRLTRTSHRRPESHPQLSGETLVKLATLNIEQPTSSQNNKRAERVNAFKKKSASLNYEDSSPCSSSNDTGDTATVQAAVTDIYSPKSSPSPQPKRNSLITPVEEMSNPKLLGQPETRGSVGRYVIMPDPGKATHAESNLVKETAAPTRSSTSSLNSLAQSIGEASLRRMFKSSAHESKSEANQCETMKAAAVAGLKSFKSQMTVSKSASSPIASLGAELTKSSRKTASAKASAHPNYAAATEEPCVPTLQGKLNKYSKYEI